MERNIFTTILLTLLLGVNIEISDTPIIIRASEEETTTTTTCNGSEIGYSINLATDDFIDHTKIKTTTPIFANSWLQGLTKVKTDLHLSYGRTRIATDIEEMARVLSRNYSLDDSASQGYSLFLASAASRFTNTEYMEYSDNMYQYYSTYNYKVKKFSYELPEYRTNFELYRSKLNILYKRDVADLFDGDMTSTQFFDKYGTHIIAKAQYGGRFVVDYSLVSDRYDVWDEHFLDLSDYIEDNLHDKISQNTTIDFNVFRDFDFYYPRAKETLNIYSRGGVEYSSVSLDNLYTAYTTWLNAVESNPVVICTLADGLIPLWDILPSTYNTTANRDIFIQKYQEYAAAKENAIIETYNPSILNEEEVPTGYNPIRPGETIVTDDGFFSNYYDVVDLNDDFDIKYNYMKAHGFTKMVLCLEMQMREINMGYQLVAFLYSEKQDMAYQIGETFRYEYEGTTFCNRYSGVVFFIIQHIPIETFENEDPEDCYKLVFRYSADGAGEDNWANRDIYAQVVYQK